MDSSIVPFEIRLHHGFKFQVSVIIPVSVPVALLIVVGLVVPLRISMAISPPVCSQPLLSLTTILLVLALRAVGLPLTRLLS